MPDRVANRLGAAMRADPGKWTLTFVGEDEMQIFGNLLAQLMDRQNPRIVSGLSYWGLTPTLDWQRASDDRLYTVMQRGTRTFLERVHRLNFILEDGLPYHFVSLGVGTGEKDIRFLQWMKERLQPAKWGDVCYFPIDISPEMLRLGVRKVLDERQLVNISNVLPIQLDFSRPASLESLRTVLNTVVSDEPIIFTLLGNTLSNFDHDEQLLTELGMLLRPDDRLLIEIATTEHSNQEAADAAAYEYFQIRSFREFIVSSLRQYTDLSVNYESTVIEGSLEKDRAVLIRCYYQNMTNETKIVNLADNTRLNFPPNQRIRLLISRKYTENGVSQMVRNANLTIESTVNSSFSDHGVGISPNRFGMSLLLLRRDHDRLR